MSTSVPSRANQCAGRIDEAERAEDLLQRLQLAMDVAHDTHPFRAVSEKLRDVAMRGQAPLDGHVCHADILHLKDVQLVRREPDDEPAPSQVVSGTDVHLPGEEVAKVIVDGRVVLHIQFRREPQSAPVLHECRRIVRHVGNQDERSILIDLQAGSKLRQRVVSVHPEHGDGAVVHRVGRRGIEHRTDQLAERMPDERPQLGVHHGIDDVRAALLPRLIEALEAERPCALPRFPRTRHENRARALRLPRLPCGGTSSEAVTSC